MKITIIWIKLSLTISINKPILTEEAFSAAAVCAKNEAALCEIFPYG